MSEEVLFGTLCLFQCQSRPNYRLPYVRLVITVTLLCHSRSCHSRAVPFASPDRPPIPAAGTKVRTSSSTNNNYVTSTDSDEEKRSKKRDLFEMSGAAASLTNAGTVTQSKAGVAETDKKIITLEIVYIPTSQKFDVKIRYTSPLRIMMNVIAKEVGVLLSDLFFLHE